MKLLNKSLLWLSISLLLVGGLWSIFFYQNLLTEIKGSVDEGLDNYKRQIVYMAERDSSILFKKNFNDGFFAINELTQEQAIQVVDSYIDTALYMQDADDLEPELEPVRMLNTAFESHGKFYELQIITSMIEEDDLFKSLLIDILGFYLVLFGIVALINKYLLQRLWKPFYKILDQLSAFRIGITKHLPQANSNTTEFVELQKATRILLNHHIDSFEQQKQFIGNASHELQTPLAIIVNKLELLSEKGNLSNDQAKSISEVMQLVERLIRLNKSLLLLAKIENKQFIESEMVMLNTIINQTLYDFEDLIAYKELFVTFKPEIDVELKSNPALLQTIVSNLIRNAIFHNQKQGNIQIYLTKNSVKICNSGINKPLNSELIFQRFHKSDSEQSSTGLGLSIVQAICTLNNYQLTYHFESGMHCFTIQFK